MTKVISFEKFMALKEAGALSERLQDVELEVQIHSVEETLGHSISERLKRSAR